MKFRDFISLISILACSVFFLTGCADSNKMEDGFYTAEMEEFSHGWKEYLCILVKDDTIISAEYNARDSSGYIKSWDGEYMENMQRSVGTYPNEYTREYVQKLIDGQGTEGIDTVSGASHSGSNFVKLAAAVIKQAEEGNQETVIVKE